jgi:hypothetical protein
MELIISLASFVLSIVIIYYVIRKATSAEEHLAVLRAILENQQKGSEAVEEAMRAMRGTSTDTEVVRSAKTEADYLREARAKHGY